MACSAYVALLTRTNRTSRDSAAPTVREKGKGIGSKLGQRRGGLGQRLGVGRGIGNGACLPQRLRTPQARPRWSCSAMQKHTAGGAAEYGQQLLTGGFGGLGGAQVSEAALLDLAAMGDTQIAGGAQWLRSAAALLAMVAALVARARTVTLCCAACPLKGPWAMHVTAGELSRSRHSTRRCGTQVCPDNNQKTARSNEARRRVDSSGASLTGRLVKTGKMKADWSRKVK